MQESNFFKRTHLLLIILSFFIFAMACSSNYERFGNKTPDGSPPPTSGEKPASDDPQSEDPMNFLFANWGSRDEATVPTEEDIRTITFADLKFRFLDQKCLDCHSTSRPVRLVDYDEVVKNIENLKKVLVGGTMPKQPKKFGKESLDKLKLEPATDSQIRMLRAWIKAGMPNNGVTPPLEANFESIKANILNPKCNTCHAKNRKNAAGGDDATSGIPSDFPLFTEDYIWQNDLVSEAGGPIDEGPLYFSLIRSDEKKRMPLPLPGQTREDLSDIEKNVILTWLTDLEARKTKNMIEPDNSNSIYKVDHGAIQGAAKASSPRGAQGDQRGNHGIRSKWTWYK